MRSRILSLLFVATLSCHAAGAGDPAPALISVTGQGTVTAQPDMATVTVGVTNRSGDAAVAVAANNEAMASLNEALDEFGIEDRDRRTQGFTVQPQYDHRRNASGIPEIAGYAVVNRLTIRVRDLDRLGDLLGAVVASGSNTIDSLLFGNSRIEELLDEARRLAVANARKRASLYAREAGGQAGRVVSISESGLSLPRPELQRAAGQMAMMGASPVPISAGDNEYQAIVNMVFEFEPANADD